MKLILEVLGSCLKSIFSTIVNEDQVAYVNNRFISESGRLIANIFKITNSLGIEGLLMTVAIVTALIILSWCACQKNLPLVTNFEILM